MEQREVTLLLIFKHISKININKITTRQYQKILHKLFDDASIRNPSLIALIR
ncbi:MULTISPECIES: hypothetical protein [unclassified Paenibacillus]|uniref:hypothetical protein n=1 Tax=unclassified Paenibacillus TaxID=185978 RepID=UPI0015BC1C3E